MQIKTRMSYCYTPTRLAKSGKTDHSKYWGGCETNPSSQTSIVGGNVKWHNHSERTGVAVSYKSKHAPPFRPNSPTQSYLPRINENMCLHKDLYPLFIAALFAIVKAWKQPRCPSAGEWIHCSVFIPVSATQQERGVDP